MMFKVFGERIVKTITDHFQFFYISIFYIIYNILVVHVIAPL